MNTEETAQVLILASNYSELFPMLEENEDIDYSRSKFSTPYFVYFITKTERFGETPQLSRIIFGKEKKLKFFALYDSNSLMRDWDNKKNFFEANKPEAFVHLALSYWHCRNSFHEAKGVLEYFHRNIKSEYKIESILFEMVRIFPKAQEGSFLAFSVFSSLRMIPQTNSMLNQMGFRKDADLEFFKGASLLFDKKYNQAKDNFNRLAKNGDLFAGAYSYWALSLEETQKNEHARASAAFQKCRDALKSSMCLHSLGALDGQVKSAGAASIILPEASHVESMILSRLEYSNKEEARAVVIARKQSKPSDAKEEYVVFLPRPRGGLRTFIDNKTKTEDQVNKNYSTKKEKFDIFVYEQNVYKKVMDEGKAKMISLNPSISFRGLLILFLKYKDVALPYVELYHKAFCGTAEHKRDAEEPSDVMNTLKNAVNELKREFDYIKGFSIPRAKNSAYKFDGDFQFCLILKRPTNEHYTMLLKKKFKFTDSIPEED